MQDSNQELVDQNGEREANNHSKSLFGSIEECHDLNLRQTLKMLSPFIVKNETKRKLRFFFSEQEKIMIQRLLDDTMNSFRSMLQNIVLNGIELVKTFDFT